MNAMCLAYLLVFIVRLKGSRLLQTAECCTNPITGICSPIVNCFADPCHSSINPCDDGKTCNSNYCGGCNALCEGSECAVCPHLGLMTGQCSDCTTCHANCGCIFTDNDNDGTLECSNNILSVDDCPICAGLGEYCAVYNDGDGCNECTCNDDRSVSCTEIACSSGPCTTTPTCKSCKQNACFDPDDGVCKQRVNCFIDPCHPQINPCNQDEQCTSNYCGGCNAVCRKAGEDCTTPEMDCSLLLCPIGVCEDGVTQFGCTGVCTMEDDGNGGLFCTGIIDKDRVCVGCGINGCIEYNDGCNDCQCNGKGKARCTTRYCLVHGTPKCLACGQGYQYNPITTKCQEI